MTSIRLLPNRGKKLVYKRLLLVLLVLIGYASTSFVHADCTPTVNLGNIIQTCQGNNVQLNAFNNGASYLWSTGDTTPSIVVTSPGMYHVTVTNNCGSASDSVNVIISQHAQVNLGPDIKFCSLQPFSQTLSVPQVAGTSYQWSTGAFTNSINVSQAGTYWVTASNACGTYSDTINIIPETPNNFNLGNDTIICQSNTHSLSVGNVAGSISWSNGDTTNQISINTSGVYSVTVSNSCGTVTDSIEVFFAQDGFPITSPSSICNGTPVSLNLGFTSFPYQWHFNGSPFNQASASQPGTYVVSMNTPCGVISDTLIVTQSSAPSISNLPDTVRFCQGDSVLIAPQINGNATVQWSHGPTTDSAYVRTQGTVSLTVTNGCGSVTETVVVRRINRVRTQNIVSEYFICPGQSVDVNAYSGRSGTTYYLCTGQTTMLDAGAGNQNAVWHDLSIGRFFQVHAAGTYYVTLMNGCGFRTDTVVVIEHGPINSIDLGNDTIFCEGTLLLDPLPNAGLGYHIVWNNNTHASTFTVTQSGTYTVMAYNACDTVHDTVNVLITGAPNLNLGAFVYFCSGSDLILDALNPGSSYSWSNGDTTRTISVNVPGWYSVEITNGCGSFVDSIEVRVDSAMNINFGNDTIVCIGDSLLLESGAKGHEIILWSNGQTTPSIYASNTGTYWVQVDNACGRFTDTIYIEVITEPDFEIRGDTVMCTSFNTPHEISGPKNMMGYLWDDGSTSRVRFIQEPGKYHLTVFNGCFYKTDTITVIGHETVYVDLGFDEIFCISEPPILDPEVHDYPVVWQNGEVAPTFTPKETGWYKATVVNACGTFTDSVFLEKEVPIPFTPIDTAFCISESLNINLKELWPGDSVRWADGRANPSRTFTSFNELEYVVSNTCGEVTQTLKIETEVCDCPVYMANAFTPNGDGVNDEIYPMHECDMGSYSFRVFSRWGSMVFESNGNNEGWDGTLNGSPSPAGVYTYELSYSYWSKGYLHHRQKIGQITLIR